MSQDTQQPQTEEEDKRRDAALLMLKRQRMIIFGLLAAVAVGAIIVIIGLTQGWFVREVEVPGGLVVDQGVGDLKGEDPAAQANPDSPSIAVNGYPSLNFTAGSKSVYLGFENPAGNPCYFTFAIVLTDSGETIYQSGAVPPGKAINNATLTRALDAGTYKASIQVKTYHVESGETLNGANVDTTITVS